MGRAILFLTERVRFLGYERGEFEGGEMASMNKMAVSRLKAPFKRDLPPSSAFSQLNRGILKGPFSLRGRCIGSLAFTLGLRFGGEIQWVFLFSEHAIL